MKKSFGDNNVFLLLFIKKITFSLLRKAGCFLSIQLEPNSAVVMLPKLQNTKFRLKKTDHFFFFFENRIFWRFTAKKRVFWLRKAGCFLLSGLQPNSTVVMSPKLQNTIFRCVKCAFFWWGENHVFCVLQPKNAFFWLRKAGCFLSTELEPNSAVVMSPKLQNTNFRWKRPEHFFFFKSHFSAFYSQKTRFWGSGRQGVFLFAQLQLNSAVEIPPKLLNTNSGWKPRAVFYFLRFDFLRFFQLF